MSSAVLLFGARALLLVLLYLFLFVVIRAMRRDLVSATRPADTATAPPPPAVPATAGLAPAVTLEVLEGGQTGLPRGEHFPVRDPLLIGRSKAADLTLDDDWISARHLRLRRQDGAWLAEDMGSTNGTRVNGRPLRGPVQVRAGDVLDLGRVKLKMVDQP